MSKKIVKPDTPTDHIAVFQEKTIRRSWHENAWWFSVIDVMDKHSMFMRFPL